MADSDEEGSPFELEIEDDEEENEVTAEATVDEEEEEYEVKEVEKDVEEEGEEEESEVVHAQEQVPGEEDEEIDVQELCYVLRIDSEVLEPLVTGEQQYAFSQVMSNVMQVLTEATDKINQYKEAMKQYNDDLLNSEQQTRKSDS